MYCPICNGDSKVLDTRTNEGENTVKRRRECVACGKRFTTYERIEDMPLIVKKRNGRKEFFDRSKVLKGLVKACQKRPVTIEELEKVTAEIERELKNEYNEVESVMIGEAIMHKLAALDEVAYVRFASVYRDFNDVDTFISEINKLQNKRQ